MVIMGLPFRLRLASVRRAAEMTHPQLAALTGISEAEIVSFEDGRTVPTAEELWLLAVWLEVSVAELIEVLPGPS